MLIVRSLFISSETVLKISRDSLIKSGCVLAGAAGNVFNVADNYIGIATRRITESIRSSIFSRFRTHFIKMVHLTRIRSSTNVRRVSTLTTHEPDFRYSTRNVADCPVNSPAYSSLMERDKRDSYFSRFVKASPGWNI